jgi:uncharacterized surface protein with fasciclin (FAS1) repeats
MKKALMCLLALILACSATCATTENIGGEAAGDQEMDIVDVAVESGNFSTLVTAVQAAGLEDTLRSEGPFTVFAPTDQAFAALPAGTVAGLLRDTGTLTEILTYHVVDGKVMSSDLSDGMSVETLQGGMLVITITDEGVTVNEAMVTQPDVEASNGVIHVIDAVLIPPEGEVEEVEVVEIVEEVPEKVEAAVHEAAETQEEGSRLPGFELAFALTSLAAAVLFLRRERR